jgi:hypothetical protein
MKDAGTIIGCKVQPRSRADLREKPRMKLFSWDLGPLPVMDIAGAAYCVSVRCVLQRLSDCFSVAGLVEPMPPTRTCA